MKSGARIWLVIAAKMSVTLALLAWLLASVDWARMLEQISRLQWPMLALAVLLLFANFVPVARRWQLITSALGGKLSFLDAQRMIYFLAIINQATPSNLGGDAYRIIATARAGLEWKRATLAAVVDRLLALVALSIIATLGILALFNLDGLEHIRLFVIVGTITMLVCALATWLFFRSVLSKWLSERFELAGKILSVVDELLSSPWETLYLLALSAAVHCVAIVAMYIAATNVGLDVPVLTLLGVCAVALLAARLPISHGGWGVREGVFVLLLTPLGVAQEASLTASITYGLTELAATLLAGVVGTVLIGVTTRGERNTARGTRDSSSVSEAGGEGRASDI